MSVLLVTGAGGFVGRRMLVRLAGDARTVVAAVRSVGEFSTAADVVTLAMDLTDADSVRHAVAETRPDEVVHLGGFSSPHLAERDPAACHAANAMGTLHLLDALRREGRPCRVVLAGSAAVYGRVDPSEPPLHEERPLAPNGHYALSKAFCEGLASLCRGPLEVISTRPFNHTGPGQSTDFALPAFASQLAAIALGRCEPVLHTGDLGAIRDFVHVDDVVDAYLLLLERGTAGTVLNICSGRGLTMSRWLEHLVEAAGIEIRVQTDPNRLFPALNPVLVGDPGRILSLGWSPYRGPEQMARDLFDDWITRSR